MTMETVTAAQKYDEAERAFDKKYAAYFTAIEEFSKTHPDFDVNALVGRLFRANIGQPYDFYRDRGAEGFKDNFRLLFLDPATSQLSGDTQPPTLQSFLKLGMRSNCYIEYTPSLNGRTLTQHTPSLDMRANLEQSIAAILDAYYHRITEVALKISEEAARNDSKDANQLSLEQQRVFEILELWQPLWELSANEHHPLGRSAFIADLKNLYALHDAKIEAEKAEKGAESERAQTPHKFFDELLASTKRRKQAGYVPG